MNAVDEPQATAEVRAGCLDDSTVLRFVSGQLDDTARRAVEHEIGQCRRCSALVAALIRDGAALHVEAEDLDPLAPDAVGADGWEREWRSRYVIGAGIARGGLGTILPALDRPLVRAGGGKRMDGRGRPLLQRVP